MNRSLVLRVALVMFFIASAAQTVQAAFTTSGNVEPANPATWTSSTHGYIGKTASGTVTVDSGSDLYAYRGYIGYNSGSTGVVTVAGTGSTWNNSAILRVGDYGNGTLNITGGGAVSNSSGYIGYKSSSTGVVTVDGTGSTWANSDDLYVGRSGSGTLNISNSGAVTVDSTTYVAYGADSTGTINFGTGGGTLTTQTLFASPTQLTGTGTINTRGLVSDVDLVFDSAEDLNQTFTLNSQPGQNVTINFDMASDPNSNGGLGAGWKGSGSLAIRDGITVHSNQGYIGYKSSSTGVATVAGTGSTWNNSYNLYVGDDGSGTLNITGGGAVNNWNGYIGTSSGSTGVVTVDGTDSTWNNLAWLLIGSYGHGTLNITGGATVSNSSGHIGYESAGSTGVVTVDGAGSIWKNNNSPLFVGHYGNGTLNISGGGTVSNSYGYIGAESGSAGVVTVDGAGSTWTNVGYIYVGHSGSGALNIAAGGVVTADNVSINSQSLLAIDVGHGSDLSVNSGGGTITNNGVIRIIAGAGAAAGTVSAPISAGTWAGSGSYQAIGGEWNATNHVFTASAVQSGDSGTPVNIDLADVQRMLIEDSGTGWSIGASFLAMDSSTPLSLTATAISGGTLTALENLLYTGEAVLGG